MRGAESSFAAQGGKSGGCGIPAGATSVELTATAVGASSGFLRLWPTGATPPNATFMNYDSAFNVSNSGTIALCSSGCSSTADLTARAYGNSTDLVIDVLGYYEAPLAAVINADGTVRSGSRVVANFKLALGGYGIQFDRNVAGCAIQATPEGTTRTATAIIVSDGASVEVRTSNSSASPIDTAFSLTVTC
ncbi:MAG: hypothetical protein R2702_06520 [Acidimicrobiales bacterium]